MISKTNHRIFNLQQRNTGLKNEIESIIIIKKKCQSFLRSSCYSYMSNNILSRIRYYECSDWNKTACSIKKKDHFLIFPVRNWLNLSLVKLRMLPY